MQLFYKKYSATIMPNRKGLDNNVIHVKGAKVNNLKNIDISIPRDKLIVITGLSGSGKSSLAFDTLYAEGQRRYVESLSAYARQFLGRISKPDVEFVTGIPPAIAIEQKVNTRNPRSTVGTSTELYDYLKLLFARIGKTFSPVSGNQVKKHSVSDVTDYILSQKEGTQVMILSPVLHDEDGFPGKKLDMLAKQGFARININGKTKKISDVINESGHYNNIKDLNIVIDRIRVKRSTDMEARIADSVQTAFYEGNGICIIELSGERKNTREKFSNRFEADGMLFEEPSVHTFSFNSPVGACPECEGFGKIIGIDEDAVIPNKGLSVYDDAIACWKGEKMRKWKDRLIYNAQYFDFPIHKPYYELSEEHKQLLWTGNKYFYGLNRFFRYLDKKNYKIQYRVMLARYRGKTTCPECNGTRLKKEAFYVKVGGMAIQDLVTMPLSGLRSFIEKLKLQEHEYTIAERLIIEIKTRLDFLINVGLEYLTLNRLSSSLSGGESQRVNLSVSLGSSLVGSLYILDEPSIGLHPRDTHRLISVLQELQQIGNTVIVVEHDEDIIRSAQEIIDIGPYAGRLGGEIVFKGTHKELMTSSKSLTTSYLKGEKKIPVPDIRRKWKNYIEVIGARENNLKNLNVKFPLEIITVVTGVSGSGKSSLVNGILYPILARMFGTYNLKPGSADTVKGDIHLISGVEMVDQDPIGRSSRSNPVTYLKAYDEIRKLFADQQLSKYNGYKASHFSFNVDGGRCEECQGEGIIKVEMQFMADVELVCDNCKGKRFKQDILEVNYKEKNIYEVLEMTVDEAIDFFSGTDSTEKKIMKKLKYLSDVGLGYIKLGQSSSTLSGGESQRVKLAFFLSRERDKPSLFIFDEPTTGLHFHDINKLLSAMNALVKRGHTIIIIEHNPEVIKSADWIIDLGPEGGEKGGSVVFEGTPEEIIKCRKSYTGQYLKKKLTPPDLP